MTLPLSSIRISSHHTQFLHQDWFLTSTEAGAFEDPAQLPEQSLAWRPTIVPGTVAQSYGEDLKRSSATSHDYDAQDHWYRCTFAVPDLKPETAYRLRFDGLATLAQIWLNSTPILSTNNMFVPDVVDVTELLRAENELAICFRSLTAELAVRRPRPRWKTALVNNQQLRWVRTTLLGRIPGWTPPIAPVGPWREIALEQVEIVDVVALDIQSYVRAGTGIIKLRVTLQPTQAGQKVNHANLHVGAESYPLSITSNESGMGLTGDIEIPDAPLWWPHTHGEPRLLPCHIEVQVGNNNVTIDCGLIGFKEVVLKRDNGAVQLEANGVPIFCRGACWTINDFISLEGSPEQLRQSLELARNAGLNMLRVGGTMIYEADDFYSLCDELGIMVWQDFMFANMDYPVVDEGFKGNITQEVEVQLNRLQKHPCISVYCGSSEVQQQAAMLGLPPEEWSNEFFDQGLPRLCAQAHAGIPYFPSTPCEGALPFHVATGISHYYGVGAYRRPLSDLKHAGVKFTPECLGFSNVPDAETMDEILDGALVPPHHPAWKARVPRDSGAGWDFEDIRDHYLKLLFNLDPIALRSQDLERYYALSRAVTGEVMQRAFAEWRKPGSGCGGALVWFYKDLWPGAGWGIIDSENRPKAAYYYLQRAWAKQGILITDEGLDGLHLHIVNDTYDPLNAVVEIELFQSGKILLAASSQAVEVPGYGATTLGADALIGHFTDITYAYRFGPPKHDLVVARLKCSETDTVIGEDFYFPQGLNLPLQDTAQIKAITTSNSDGSVLVTLQSDCFLQTVSISVKGYRGNDNYFHLAPNREQQILFVPHEAGAKKYKGQINAINLRDAITLRASEPNE